MKVHTQDGNILEGSVDELQDFLGKRNLSSAKKGKGRWPKKYKNGRRECPYCQRRFNGRKQTCGRRACKGKLISERSKGMWAKRTPEERKAVGEKVLKARGLVRRIFNG